MRILPRKLATLMLLLLACALTGISIAPNARALTPTPTATKAPTGTAARPTPITTGVPRFEQGPCTYNLFSSDLVEGQNVLCGIAVVPEQHSKANNGRTIRLPVAVVLSPNPTPAPEPIFLLAGGPGQPGQIFGSILRGPLYRAYTANNDIIFHDQRGTGASVPNLSCPELGDARPQALQALLNGIRANATYVDVTLRCRDRLLKQGVNLAAFTTTENAADVNDIRAVLGYAKMNILGISYGTELGLAIERDFPQYTRSAVLESVVPHQLAFFFKEPQTFDRAMKELGNACKQDATCNGYNADVVGNFQKGVANLNANPAQITVTDPTFGDKLNIPVNGTTYTRILFQLLYSTSTIPYLPDFIGKVAQGDYAFLQLLVQSLIDDSSIGTGIATGMHYSMECTHDTSEARYKAELALDQNTIPEARVFEQASQQYYQICNQWPTKGQDPKADLAVNSSVPTILVNNQFDPITPPEYGAEAKKTLSNSISIVVPGGGHSASTGIASGNPIGTCSTTIFLSFVRNPTTAPDTSCLAQLKVTYKRVLSAQTSPTVGATTPGSTSAPSTTAPTTTRGATPTPTMMIPGLPDTGRGNDGMTGSDSSPLPLLALAALLGAMALAVTAFAQRRRT